MVWDDVATLWEDSNDKDNVSLTSKEHVEDKVNNVYVEKINIDENADTCIWYNILSRGNIRGRNVKPQ